MNTSLCVSATPTQSTAHPPVVAKTISKRILPRLADSALQNEKTKKLMAALFQMFSFSYHTMSRETKISLLSTIAHNFIVSDCKYGHSYIFFSLLFPKVPKLCNLQIQFVETSCTSGIVSKPGSHQTGFWIDVLLFRVVFLIVNASVHTPSPYNCIANFVFVGVLGLGKLSYQESVSG